MVKDIHIIKYKKFKNQIFSFTPQINLISGTNGTCKTTLLHIVSNSFQELRRTCEWITDNDFLRVFKGVNHQINPKMENLARGDKTINDPAQGHKGNLYGVTYFGLENDDPIAYRRHNTRNAGEPRYYIKPLYPRGSGQKLPYCPVVYLSLSRLLPYGEYQNDADITASRVVLPPSYIQESCEIYQQLTGININTISTQKIGALKTRMEFSSDIEGVDSNTISSGEDNLSIIISALLSLKYYYNSIEKEYAQNQAVCSILLIDEIDATLHPSVQDKLLSLLGSFSQNFKIQVFATTHSLSLLEYALNCKHNVTYLINNITSVEQLKDPDIYRIKMHLSAQSKTQLYKDKVIPIYTEDKEARDLVDTLFKYWMIKDLAFKNVNYYFHFVNANLGAENLKGIFQDHHLKTSTIHAICILDGDHTKDMTHQIIALPGKDSPEKFLIKYALELFNSQTTPFWQSTDLMDAGYSRTYFVEKIRPDIEATQRRIDNGGKEREVYKELYGRHDDFLLRVFNHWVTRSHHQSAVEGFFKDLNSMFKKVAPLKGINPNEWPVPNAGQITPSSV